jgi:hypothetical protein
MHSHTPLVPGAFDVTLGATAAIILFSSATMSFAGNFTPVPKNKIVQSQSCLNNCQTAFDLCVRLNSGSIVVRNCQSELSSCQTACQLNPRGG